MRRVATLLCILSLRGPLLSAQPALCAATPEELLPWEVSRLGPLRSAGAAAVGGGLELCSVSDARRPDTEPALLFLSQQGSGNFEVRVQIKSVDGAGWAGVMARTMTESSNSADFALAVRRTADGATNLFSAHRRSQTVAVGSPRASAVAVMLPVYLKLTRSGTLFRSAYSRDGANFQEYLTWDARGTSLAADELSVGVAQSPEAVAARSIARLDSVVLTAPDAGSTLVSLKIDGPLIGGAPARAVIIRSMPSEGAPMDVDTAQVVSDNPSLTVPATVAFLEDANSATFTLEPQRVKKQETATVSVRMANQIATDTTTILPQTAPAAVTIGAATIVDGEPRATGIVRLRKPAPPGGVEVTVSTDSPQSLTYPKKVIIPEGQDTVMFDLRGEGLLSPTSPSLTASSSGTTVRGLGGLALRENVTATEAIAGPSGRFCIATPAKPDIATDGQRVYLTSSAIRRTQLQEGMAVFLTGYRYNDSPPTVTNPAGEGREEIYCGCQRLHIETASDPDGIPRSRFYFVVPMDAPSGQYEIRIDPAAAECNVGGVRAGGCPNDCAYSSVFVTPSYLVSILRWLNIISNSEDADNHPAEMKFAFGSFSGTPVSNNGQAVSLVQFSGTYPAGSSGSGHATNADNTHLIADVPLYIGAESRMTGTEWQEECVALPGARETECATVGTNYVSQGRFSDHFEFAFAGVEFDSSPSKLWGLAAGVGTAALSCFIGAKAGSPCGASDFGGIGTSIGAGGLGVAVGAAVNEALKNDDDNLGVLTQVFNFDPFQPFRWTGGNAIQAPFKLDGAHHGGDIDVAFQNRRVGAPRILSYTVTLESLTVLDDYEEAECKLPNDVFLEARAFLYDGGSVMPSATRLPEKGNWKLNQGETETFGGVGWTIGGHSYALEDAPASPLLYVELGAWENDRTDDLMGLHSETVWLADLLSSGVGDVSDTVTPEGHFVRRVVQHHTREAHGFAGSDNHCWGTWAYGWNPNANEGRVRLTYKIDVTWLKEMNR